ncbi:hypothetical protein BGZ73_001076 [Actinomortierella ambigua]|nr:hypothetical protein BGZ73_001076 [Actinomortierella ambigua]
MLCVNSSHSGASFYRRRIIQEQNQTISSTSRFYTPNTSSMLARTFITYVAVAAVALFSVANAAPVDPAAPPELPADIKTLEAEPQEMEGTDFVSVPKMFFPICCQQGVRACCIH